jgi:pimeloyl-ACP methyl ester carboxylesterase
MEHRTTSSQRGRIHYWTGSEAGSCIVFTHGTAMDHGLFLPQMEAFAFTHKVIGWDAPLHGLSRPYEGFSLKACAEELVRILDAEGIERAHLVGQSMGGYISQLAALARPERISTLTAVDSAPIQASYYSTLDNWLLAITPSLLRLYPYRTLIDTISNQLAVTPAGKEYALRTLEGHAKAEIVGIMAGISRGLRECPSDFRLPIPVLIICGDQDHTGKVRRCCEEWARREDRALRILPNAAHNSNLDNPVEFNRRLEEFLALAG